jgi:hypothetical protein
MTEGRRVQGERLKVFRLKAEGKKIVGSPQMADGSEKKGSKLKAEG